MISPLLLCAISAAAVDLCSLILIVTALRERSLSSKRWDVISSGMELVEQGHTYRLGCDEIIIGRHASADIRLIEMTVSRYHALLTVADGVWTVTDLGSKSGVFVNGIQVKKKKLHENDTISIGSHQLTLRKRRNKRNV